MSTSIFGTCHSCALTQYIEGPCSQCGGEVTPGSVSAWDCFALIDTAPTTEPLHPHNDGLDEYRQPVHVGELDPAQRLALARGGK